jgi:hypothetical protein
MFKLKGNTNKNIKKNFKNIYVKNFNLKTMTEKEYHDNIIVIQNLSMKSSVFFIWYYCTCSTAKLSFLDVFFVYWNSALYLVVFLLDFVILFIVVYANVVYLVCLSLVIQFFNHIS